MSGDETRGEAEASSSVDASSRTFKTEVTQGPCCHTWVEGADICIACGAALTFAEAEPEDDHGLYLILAATRGLSIDGCNDLIDRLRPWLARRDAERDRARDAEVRRVVVEQVEAVLARSFLAYLSVAPTVQMRVVSEYELRAALAEIEEGSP